jgi:sugar/nucleoside kinase (ribokinase family)
MTAQPKHVDVMMIGHFARDRVVVDGQSALYSGGAVFYGSVALRRLGVSVAVVTRLHPNDFHFLAELEQEDVVVFATPAPQTSGIENRYNSADMERRVCRPLGFAGPIQRADIPPVSAAIYAITPIMAGEVDLNLLKALAKRGPVALDVQGFVRIPAENDLVFRPWVDLEEGLAQVTYLKVDRAEAELLTGLTDLAAAAQRLAEFGPAEIVLTETAGVMVYANGQLYRVPFTSRSLEGRTGRGDTCFATYLGKRLTAPPEVAARWAGIVTSFKQEKVGPWRGNTAEVEIMLARS